MNKFTLGADPEMFMQDAAGAFKASCDLIGGTKVMPRSLPIGPGFAVQEDNVAVEYNIPPSSSQDMFVNNISQIMQYLSNEIKQYGLHFVNVSATSEWSLQDLMHPKAQEFGCDPDFNAWNNGKRNPRPRAPDQALRTCGGHLHIGHKFESVGSIINFIKHMDLFTVGSVLMDKGELRKQLYGKAGAYRRKPYGCEYRSLSNFWIFDEKYIRWAWDCVDMAMDAWQNNKIDVDANAPLILDAINNNNKHAAMQLIETHNLLVV